MKRFISWLFESNRFLHLCVTCAFTLVLGWESGITSIVAFELKDVQRSDWSAWDWLDCLAGAIGMFVGGVLRLSIGLPL